MMFILIQPCLTTQMLITWVTITSGRAMHILISHSTQVQSVRLYMRLCDKCCTF